MEEFRSVHCGCKGNVPNKRNNRIYDHYFVCFLRICWPEILFADIIIGFDFQLHFYLFIYFCALSFAASYFALYFYLT